MRQAREKSVRSTSIADETPLSNVSSDAVSHHANTKKIAWCPRLRELTVSGVLIKRFRRPAPVLDLILSAFQEEGWPPQLDDPIPPTLEVDSVTRLHDATNRLNRTQKPRLIVFFGDGTGRGIRWRFAE